MSIRGAGSGKAGGGSARTPVEAKDTLRSISYAKVIDVLCEGEIGGLVDGESSIFINGTPIRTQTTADGVEGTENFTGVISIDERTGTQNQTALTGYQGTASEFDVSTEVKFGIPIVRTVTRPEIDAVNVTIGIPALQTQNTTNGDLSGASVDVAIDVQSNGGGYVAQIIGFLYEASVNPSTKASIGLQIDVQWTLLPTVTPPTNNRNRPTLTYATMEYDVQYRQVGAGGWTTLKRDSITSADNLRLGRQSNYYIDGRSNNGDSVGGNTWQNILARLRRTRTYRIDGIPALIYEARVVIVAGNGTAVVSAFRIAIQTAFDRISGKTSSTYLRQYRIELPVGGTPWDVRVRRITADSVTVSVSNKTFFQAYAEVIDEKFTYPNTALIGITIDAAQFSSIPTRGYEVKLLKVKIPSNYNPISRVYTGIWDGNFVVAWTDNPAWCFYDLVTNTRYGLGAFLPESSVDKWGLYTIAQYCDEMCDDGDGKEEPRFRCNVYLQSRTEAYAAIAAMASVFRGMAYWAGGALFAVQDAPSDPVFLFTEANVIDGLFTYMGTAKNARHTVALVSWSDPNDGYKLRPEYVEDLAGIALFGVNTTAVTAMGATSRGQAHRLGKWILYSERLETEALVFRCGHEGIYVRPGSIFAVQDQHRAGIRYGGRIVSAANNMPVANLFSFSQDFANASWVKIRSSVVANVAADPDGFATADKLVEDGTASNLHHVHKANFPVANSTPVTVSVYAKADTRDQITILVQEGIGGADNFEGMFDLTLGTVFSTSSLGTGTFLSATITPVGSGWYRCTISGIYATTGTVCDIFFFLATNGTRTYSGDSVSGLYLWGAQLEYGAVATIYSPTTETSVTQESRVILDHAINIEAGQIYTLQVVLPNGTLETKTVINSPGSASVLTLSGNFSVAPITPAVWLVTSTAISPRLYRALSVAEQERNIYEINAIEHNNSKYDAVERDTLLIVPSYSNTTTMPTTPQNVVLREILRIVQGMVVVVVAVRWDHVDTAKHYRVQWRRDEGNYVVLTDVMQASAEILDAPIGYYEVRVTAVNVLSAVSDEGVGTRQIYGKTLPPADVPGFIVARNVGVLVFSWGAVPDLDLAYYEIRQGTAWESAVLVETGITARRLEVTTHTGSTYLLKAVDSSGNESVAPAAITIAKDADINVVVIGQDNPSWSGTKVATQGDSAGLTLVNSQRWNTLTNFWNTYPLTWYQMGSWTTPGTYETVPVDVGVVMTSRVEVLPVTEQILISPLTWLTLTNAWLTYEDPWEGVTGLVGITYEFATSQDAAAYTAYGPFQAGFYTARAFKFRITLTTLNVNYLPRLKSFAVTIDVPDRVIHFEDAVVGTSGKTLTFSPAFVVVQTVTGTIQAGAIGDVFRVTNKSPTGATIIVYDSAGTPKDGLVDIDAFGYGSI